MSTGMSKPTITATGAGLLGLLRLRSWTSYQLTAQLRRSLRFVLPRAESAIYAEQKRLAAAGLARVSQQPQGRRRRTVYGITETGRGALRQWLSGPPAEPSIEIEPLLRVLFADAGDLDDLERALDTLERWAAEQLAEGRRICQGYLDGDAPFPERLHLSSVFAGYYFGLYTHTLDWVTQVRAEARTWPATGDVGLTPGTRLMLERIVAGDHRAPPTGAGPGGPPRATT